MKSDLLDYSDFCVSGIEFFDGQRIDGFESYVSYGVFIHENVDVEKLNKCVLDLYEEIDCFHMHLQKNENGISYCFDKNIKENIHIIEPTGKTYDERATFAKENVFNKSSKVRDRYVYSPFFVELYPLSDNEYFLAAYIDRYVADGHSIGVALMKMLGAYKDTVIQGGISVKSMMDYKSDVDNPKHKQIAEVDKLYWQEHLDTYKIEPYFRKSNTNAYDNSGVVIYLSKQEICDKAKVLKSTVGILLMSVFHLTICSVFDTSDNVISYVSTDRNSLDDWGIIGPFVKPLNSRVIVCGSDSIKDFVKKVSKETGNNIRHKNVRIKDMKINRYGMLFLNHSKPFLVDEVFTQWMPGLSMDQVDADFFYIRMQELGEEIELSFVCNKKRICREDYDSVVNKFQSILREILNDFDRQIENVL